MDLVSTLQYFGIIPKQVTPIILVAIICGFILWKYFLRDVKQEVTDLHHASKEMQKFLQERVAGWTPQHILSVKPVFAYGKSDSPITPNESGKKLLEESRFNEVYPKLKDKLFGLMDAMNLRTLYDYEKGSAKALEQLKNDPLLDVVKEYSVNHPNEPLELIFEVASWVIRDDYDSYKKSQNK